MLTRDQILSVVPALPRQAVPVPEWHGSVNVRVLTGAERDRLEVEWEQTKRVNFRARLALYTVCDDTGKNLFQPQDLAVLAIQPTTVLSRIADVAFPLNRFTKEDVEELEKNSETDPSVGSPSV